MVCILNGKVAEMLGEMALINWIKLQYHEYSRYNINFTYTG